ncbi:hypothetical protein ACWC2T_22900 [Streptomyces sp. NPDC001393]
MRAPPTAARAHASADASRDTLAGQARDALIDVGAVRATDLAAPSAWSGLNS